METAGNGISKDHFLLNPPLKPKAEIADYIDTQGLLTPRRFSGLQEALASGKPFIVRSEHPQDYEGASGLGESIIVSDESIKEGKEKLAKIGRDIDWSGLDRIANNPYWDVYYQIVGAVEETSQDDLEDKISRLGRKKVQRYCELMNIGVDDFETEGSYSYWEFIPGRNQVVIADSGIKDRYHIFTYTDTRVESFDYNYSVVDNRQVVMSGPWKIDGLSYTSTDLAKTIDFYERIRNLDVFHPNHVPLLETTFSGDKRYFLQYHRSRDFRSADFKLERGLKDGELEADFVRGITPSEGFICETSLWYDFESGLQLGNEDASFDFHWNSIFSELMTPRRKVQFIIGQDWNHMALKTIDMHVQKSKLFKPQVSIFLDQDKLEQLFPETESFEGSDFHKFRPTLKVISDGRRAIVERI